MALWGSRFEDAPGEFFATFNRSFSYDRRLVFHDIEASRAWAFALARLGILTRSETIQIARGLRRLEKRLRETPEMLEEWSRCEDVHTFVQEYLVSEVGDVGLKLHTGRSRNDLVATDLRLYAKDACGLTLVHLRDLMFRLLTLAEVNKELVIPAYTHARRAQPILLAHWALAYLEMFLRDAGRIRQVAHSADVLPLGSGAVAGAPLLVDRQKVAEDLGFSRVSDNSLDAVSDRDFVVEYLSAAALAGVHLSRLAEDLILYTSDEFGLAEIGDDVSTGSSLLPHKKNPDSLELIRGKTGRLCGHLQAMLVVIKGLPTAYNKDLQEDKEGFFDAVDTLNGCLRLMSAVVAGLAWNEERCREAAGDRFMPALQVANYLVGKGVAHRRAHDIAGSLVRECLQTGETLATLPFDVYRRHSDRFEKEIYAALRIESQISASSARGGTAPLIVDVALARAQKRVLHCADEVRGES